ncbi:MAG: ABC transporter permease [Clostridiales Family XIII bacterium]|jgi:hypothetical protein|nr:ABC transporter permease [Clostridiales Family XIII bacterium]
MPPDERTGDFGRVNAVIPEKTMPNACATLATEYLYERGNSFADGYSDISGVPNYIRQGYMSYSELGFIQRKTLSPEGRSEIADILYRITGLTAEEISSSINGLYEPLPFEYRSENDYSGRIPVLVDYGTFTKEMRRVDQIIGGNSAYAEKKLILFATREATYEEKYAEYEGVVKDDMVTNAYARYYCDYMMIMVALLCIFIPVSLLLRDRRARMSELLASRSVGSAQFIAVRYAASVTMALLPVFLISLIPTAEFIVWGGRHGIRVDPFAFIKYEALWLLPTILAITGVGFLLTVLTDTPVAIPVQIAWSWIAIMGTGMALMDIQSGVGGWWLVLRFNLVGGHDTIMANATHILANRVLYAALGIGLMLLTVAIYEMRRKGRIDVLGKIRFAAANRKISDSSVAAE